MDYDAKKDDLIPTSEMIEGDSEILKSIAGRVKEWSGNWDRVIQNIELRAKISQLILDYSNKTKNEKILESDFIVQSNDAYHKISERIAGEIGYATPSRVLKEYDNWLKTKLRKSKI